MNETPEKLRKNWKVICLPNDDLYLPKEPCVYVVFAEDELMYVGSTRNICNRIRGHKINYARYSAFINTPWGQFRKVTIKYRVERELGEAAMAEIKLLNKLQPKKNKLLIS